MGNHRTSFLFHSALRTLYAGLEADEPRGADKQFCDPAVAGGCELSGGRDLGSNNDKRGSKTVGAKQEGKAATAARKGDGRDVGRVLRSVYDRTLEESIPPEMLDLLGKLD